MSKKKLRKKDLKQDIDILGAWITRLEQRIKEIEGDKAIPRTRPALKGQPLP